MFNVKKYQIAHYYDSFIGSSSEIRIFSKPAETNREGVQNQEEWPVGNLNYFWVASISPSLFPPKGSFFNCIDQILPIIDH